SAQRDDACALEADVGTLADAAAQGVAVDHDQAAVVHAHVHVVGLFVDLVLDGVAGHRASDRARHRGGVLLALAAVVGELAGGHGADQAAEHGAGAAVGAGAIHRLDAFDPPAVLAALRVAAVVGVVTRAAVVT